MKTLISILACLLFAVPSQGAGEEPERQEHIQQQLEDHEKQLQEIEEYISRRRRQIESCYRGELIELRQRVEAEIRLLEVADKALLYAPVAAQLEAAKMALHINSYGHRAPWYLEAKTERTLHLKGEREFCRGFGERIGKRPERFAVAQSLIAEKKSEILAKLEWEALDLEKQKEYALNVRLVELEKRLKRNVIAPKPKATRGVVTGLVYADEAPLVLVVGKILHEGDTIWGVKVLKIRRDRVELEKDARRWEQKVGDAAERYWR